MSFDLMFDAIYGNDVMAYDAEYQPLVGDAFPIRVIPKRPDEISKFEGSLIQSNTAQFNVRTSELATPVRGDKIVFDDTTYTVQGAKYKDVDRSEWLIDTYPT